MYMLCSRVQSRPFGVGCGGIRGTCKFRMVRQEVGQRPDIPISTLFEEAPGVPCRAPLNFGFQRAPTGKTVVPRDGQLGVRERCLRVRDTKVAQTLLGDLLEVFERRALGKLRVRHRRLPSVYRPESAFHGLEVRVSSGLIDCRWVQPSTRTVGRVVRPNRILTWTKEGLNACVLSLLCSKV